MIGINSGPVILVFEKVRLTAQFLAGAVFTVPLYSPSFSTSRQIANTKLKMQGNGFFIRAVYYSPNISVFPGASPARTAQQQTIFWYQQKICVDHLDEIEALLEKCPDWVRKDAKSPDK